MFVHPAARAAGFRRVELLATLTGKPLYLACGYEPLEDVEWTMPDGVKMTGMKMGKTL